MSQKPLMKANDTLFPCGMQFRHRKRPICQTRNKTKINELQADSLNNAWRILVNDDTQEAI